ncbi:hypothetical protein C2845_PM01G28870 [Panicum miliaceum]|uniref:Cyclin C-terminal domain-containing protein n=1 Tax=Panicum miliaceum TaxID=4540 RepID=A0A3L6TIP8_PANMI|nr:hypothetical protein C2845_PM01G28870 [Panicum miliaceum]
MADFRTSSQRERWIFQPHDLTERWAAANQRAAETLAQVGSVEENHVSAEELGKGIQQDHQIILNNEMILLKTLDFDLIVYAPYRSIEGFVDDLEGFCREDNSALQRLKELHQTAISYADKMMLTDAPLLYTPGQLALAALHKSNDTLKVFNFERYLETIFSRQHSDCPVEQFVQSINAIHYLVKVFAWLGVMQFIYKSVVRVDQLKIPTVKDMRHVDRKLKHCWDRSSHDEHKKKEKKSKHKSKRTSDAQLNC